MVETINEYRILVGKPVRKDPDVRPWRRWENIIKLNLWERGWRMWGGLNWPRTSK